MTPEKITVKSVLVLLGGVGALGAGILTFNPFSHNQTGDRTTINSNSSNNSTNVDNSNNSTNINNTTNSSGIGTAASQPPNTTNQAAINIQTPKGGDVVEREILMTGTLSNLGGNENLWVYVYAPGEKRYYPTQAIYFSNNKTWRAPLVIGSVRPTDSGASFRIGVFTANTSLAANLSVAGEKGMNNLPTGVKPLTEILVARK